MSPPSPGLGPSEGREPRGVKNQILSNQNARQRNSTLPMKLIALITALILPMVASYGQTGNYESLKADTASRLTELTGESGRWEQHRLSELLDFESRASIAQRLEKNYAIKYNWEEYSLDSLLDVEARVSTAARIQRRDGIALDWSKSTVAQLIEAESRISAASEIKREFEQDVPWRDYTAGQLLEIQSELAKKRTEKEELEASIEAERTRPAELELERQPEGDAPAESGTLNGLPTPASTSRDAEISRERGSNTSSIIASPYHDPSYGTAVGDYWVDSHYRKDGTHVEKHRAPTVSWPSAGRDLRDEKENSYQLFEPDLAPGLGTRPDNGGRFAEVNSPFPPRNRVHSDDRDDDGLMDFYTRQGKAIQPDGEGSYSVMDLNTGRMTAVQSDGEGNYSAMDLNTGKMSAIKVNSDGSAAVMDLETGRISFLP
jgi:hypothetical protein